MSNISEAVTMTVTWHTGGPNPCKKCQALNGYMWHEQPLYLVWLTHPMFGPVWDLEADSSLAHPNCYCTLDVELDVDLETLQID